MVRAATVPSPCQAEVVGMGLGSLRAEPPYAVAEGPARRAGGAGWVSGPAGGLPLLPGGDVGEGDGRVEHGRVEGVDGPALGQSARVVGVGERGAAEGEHVGM